MNTSNILAHKSTIIESITLVDFPGFLELVIRFSLNLAVILLLVKWLYFSTTKRKDYLFTYILISSIVFLLCFILENVILQLGFALGLFAIFGIIRYRTDAIPIKEMTYLFLTIGISVINALTGNGTSILEVLFTNIVIIALTYGLEKRWLLKHESSKNIIYEKLEFVKPENHNDLIADLQNRTGISKIDRIELKEIDFMKGICHIKIFYEIKDLNK